MSGDISTNSVRLACLQMNSSASVDENLAYVEKYAELAKQKQVDVLLLPENFAQMPAKAGELHIEYPNDGPVQACLEGLSRQLGMFIIAGSIPIKCDDNSRPFSRSLVFDNQGIQVAQYDKIHLFDVDLADGQSYRESATYKPAAITGSESISVAQTKFATLGLTICYDLRFPEMYRKLAQLGAQIITVPSAFTYDTGSAHWQTLLRARAIENQVFIVAAAQDGIHQNARRTWGHSMIVDPWGNIIAQPGSEKTHLSHVEINKVTKSCTGLVIGDIDLTLLATVRAEFPVLKHRRLF